MQTFDILALLILNGRVANPWKTPDNDAHFFASTKVNYECTFSVSQRARKIITSSPSVGLFRGRCPHGR
ncbi:hypothetical protein BB542_16000 [Escherichia coli]|nr:hypothetical protein BB542_16000 [Escherichia coli]